MPLLFGKKGDLPKRVVDFLLERDTFRNKIMQIVEDFDEQSYNNNGKPLKSSRILRLMPHFFIFSLFIIFRHFSFVKSFFFIFSFFSHFFIFFISFTFSFFQCYFLHFYFFSCSFIFLLFSFLFLSLFWVTRNLIFFGLNCFRISCNLKN